MTRADAVRPCDADGEHWRRNESLIARRIAAVYVLYAAVAVMFLAMNMPPFQNPDELAHFLRAAQVADGGVTGSRFPATAADGTRTVTAGGLVDPAIPEAYGPFGGLPFHPETRTTRANLEPRIHWSGQRVLEGFPNTAINPPLFYLPSAAGIMFGRITRMTVVQSLVLSRILTGLAALAVGAAAIACAGGGAPMIFALLTLPMSLSLTASTSPDALTIAFAALAGALLVRLLRQPNEQPRRTVIWFAAALTLIVIARLPYLALALLPLAAVGVRARWRILAVAAIFACAGLWSIVTAARSMTNFGAFVGADQAAQMSIISHDPLVIFKVAKETLSHQWFNYLEGFVGRLGWYDTSFPPIYHKTALVMLTVAAAAAILGSRGRRTGTGARCLILATMLISVAGVFAAVFLDWTPPGELIVEGVQGRYFIPIVLAGAGLLPAFGHPRWAHAYAILIAMVIAFPIVSLAMIERAVVVRYYLG